MSWHKSVNDVLAQHRLLTAALHGAGTNPFYGWLLVRFLILPACSTASRPLRCARAACGGAFGSLDPVCAREAVRQRERNRVRKGITMSFDVERVSHELIAALQPLLPRIQRRDRALAVQLTRAASSISLNVSEANYSDPGNRRARFYTAAGSANETRSALRVATAWGYLSRSDSEVPLQLLDRILAMLWKLSH